MLDNQLACYKKPLQEQYFPFGNDLNQSVRSSSIWLLLALSNEKLRINWGVTLINSRC
ncbi:uncharacterized protein METZ01_LOCUS517186 [marine metagenome]|uniref:Uncharacterized protein n=1 Tax=marine metagenome TaxID=408172 RepID=A0A383F582_9ZZZZ